MEGIIGIYDDYFAEGNTLGITWVAASGDWGGKDIPAPACFTASPPNPCGPMEVGIGLPGVEPARDRGRRTNLVTTYKPPSLNSAYVKENADDDPLYEDIFFGTSATGAVWGSGGGISSYFAKPSYQNVVSQKYLPSKAKKWRTTPDVALKVEEGGGRLGNLNYEIYALAAGQANGSYAVYRQDIPGNNGVYSTAPGYNLVLGNGTVIANAFVQGPGLAVAGVPQTPTNP